MIKKPTTRLFAVLVTLAAARGAAGCGGDGGPPPSSPVVSVDSEQGRKAQGEDAALRALRRQQEAKAASRKRGLRLPPEG